MDQSKRPALLELCRLLGQAQVSYALIGGLALQVHQREPRTTLDIDVAVVSRDDIPRGPLESAGFRFDAVFEHSENRVFTDGTPVQFTDDPAFKSAVESAEGTELEGAFLRVIRVEDLLHAKLRAGDRSACRTSRTPRL